MKYYEIMVFEPSRLDSSCVVMYYSIHRNDNVPRPSESTWIVPGTMEG